MSAASQIPNKTLAVRGLTKRMGERVLWSGLNLEFLPGQMTALTGQSGCGKTTLLNVLGLLERPTGGVVTYGTRDLTDGSPRTRRLMHRNVMGFMFQNYALVEQWTVARNLQLANGPSHGTCSWPCAASAWRRPNDAGSYGARCTSSIWTGMTSGSCTR